MASFRIMIPTRDSAAWVGVFLEFYRKLGVEPLYVVDTRSTDATLAILRGMNAEFVEFTPSGDFAEAGMIEFGSARAGTEWVLRIDDDEFPANALLKWIDSMAARSLNQVAFVSRRELFVRDNTLFYSRSAGRFSSPYRPGYLQPHARLHHVERVNFVQRVHTPGIENPLFFTFAPEDDFIVHLNCLLRSPSERLLKLRRYEAIEAMSCWRLADEYLPELFSLDHHGAQEDGLNEFRELIDALPVASNVQVPELSDAERELAIREVSRLARALREVRVDLDVITDADELRWLHYLPKRVWRPLAEFLCSIGKQKSGVAVWNYDALSRRSENTSSA